MLRGIPGLAALNLVRAPARSVAVFVYLAALTAMLFSGAALYAGVAGTARLGAERLGADAIVVPEGQYVQAQDILLSGGRAMFTMPASVTDQVRAMPDVSEVSTQLFLMSGPLACCALSDTLLVGFDPAHDFTLAPWLRERISRPLADDEVIVGANILAEPQGTIAFYGQPFKIAGKLDPTGLEQFDGTVFIPMQGARRMVLNSTRPIDVRPDEISAVLVKFAEGVNPEATALKIEARLSGYKVVLARKSIARFRESMLGPLYAAFAAGAVQWLAGLVMIGAMFSFIVRSRRQELVLMRAMGARLRDLRAILLIETSILGMGAGVSGVTAGLLALWIFRGALMARFHLAAIYPQPVIMLALASSAVVFSVLTALASSTYALSNVAKVSPHAAVRQSD